MGLLPGDSEETQLLKASGVESFEELLRDVPVSHRLKSLNLADHLSERDAEQFCERLSQRNRVVSPARSALGAGVCYRYIPVAVDMISSRSEFYTAYTPYQPEISQGTLTAIFEFQSYITDLTGMGASNASLYDGATALAESLQMAKRISAKKSDRFVIVGAIPPQYREVLDTYNQGYGFQLDYFDAVPDVRLGEDICAMVLMLPDFFGRIQDYSALIDSAKTMAIGVIFGVLNPLALVLYKTPGEWGADIVFGEGISLGNYPSFGGPALGFIATRKEFVRHLPGRVVGQTLDKQGRIGYVLTFQTREQHIRREKATSNICSNQGLMALRATIYLSLLGSVGLTRLANEISEKTQHLIQGLSRIPKLKIQPNEQFSDVLVTSDTLDFTGLNQFLREQSWQGGVVLDHLYAYWDGSYLVSVNEFMSLSDIDQLVALVAQYSGSQLISPRVSSTRAIRRKATLRIPDRSEGEVVRHFTQLSTLNYGVDSGFYPLGSCTMKYNFKLLERVAGFVGFQQCHPFAEDKDVQGTLEMMSMMNDILCEIFGYEQFTLQPAAGSHGEHTGLLIIRAYHHSRGDKDRHVVLVPDTAHGTNPASASVAGFDVVSIAINEQGNVDMAALKAALKAHKVAALMLTNPSTLGLFETQILQIATCVHEAGGLLYYDGANANALLGIIRPGDMG
ncbi:MAG: aminomethyl-transferring glycine dehydrogenase subunit GcvPA, partial [Candidatus Margulisiibacteriota bacterium]